MPVKIGTVELSDEDVEAFREVFNLVDSDSSGSISAMEVKQLFEMLGIHMSADDILQMMDSVDEDKSGEVDFHEFLQVMAGSQQPTYTRRDLLRAFRMFAEKEAPAGHISIVSLENTLKAYCKEELSEEEISRLVCNLTTTDGVWVNYILAVNVFMSK